MANMPAHFKVVDIERILRAAKNAGVPVRIGIDGAHITVENLSEHGQPTPGSKEAIEPTAKIVL
jgi:hypothetical protein